MLAHPSRGCGRAGAKEATVLFVPSVAERFVALETQEASRAARKVATGDRNRSETRRTPDPDSVETKRRRHAAKEQFRTRGLSVRDWRRAGRENQARLIYCVVFSAGCWR